MGCLLTPSVKQTTGFSDGLFSISFLGILAAAWYCQLIIKPTTPREAQSPKLSSTQPRHDAVQVYFGRGDLAHRIRPCHGPLQQARRKSEPPGSDRQNCRFPRRRTREILHHGSGEMRKRRTREARMQPTGTMGGRQELRRPLMRLQQFFERLIKEADSACDI